MKAGVIALAATLLACARTVPQRSDGPQLASGGQTAKPIVVDTSGASCPLALPGTTLSLAATTGGESMLFSAPDDELEALRERVHLLAERHNRAPYHLAMLDVPHRAQMVPIPGGARLDLVTGIGNDTLELQRAVEMNAELLLQEPCGASK